MNRKLKRLLVTVCVLLGIMGLTGCASNTTPIDKVVTLSDSDVETYKNNASQTIQAVVGFDDAMIDQYLEQSTDEFVITTLESWKTSKEELGAFKEVTAQGVVEEGKKVEVDSLVTFEKGTATVPLVIDAATGNATSMAFNVNYTFGQTMEKAGLNTLMGIGIVFCMLLFLSFLISQFKHIADFEAKLAKKKADKAAQNAPAVQEAPVAAAPVEEELVDDGELVAVIAAAIAASENTSTDSFTVRSIRRAKSNKWKRA